jgi:hypothetical protein
VGIEGRRNGARRVALVAPLALALAFAAPAAARPSASGTLTYVGASTFVLTVTNTGAEAFESFGTAVTSTNLVPASACENRETSIVCRGQIPPGYSKQVCFTDPSLGASETLLVTAGSGGLANETFFDTTPGAAMASCPLLGNPSGVVTGKKTSGSHAWSRVRCVRAYKSWRKKHRHASRRAKKAEARTLRKLHGCRLAPSLLR